jgi:hypothetical protein
MMIVLSLLPIGRAAAVEKALYLPQEIDRVPKGNDFNDVASEFCFKHMVQGGNVALLWSKEYGDDRTTNPDEKKRFDPAFALKECERFYSYYVDELKIVLKGQSLADKYKMLVFVFGGNEGTAYGGGAEDKTGILWTPSTRISTAACSTTPATDGIGSRLRIVRRTAATTASSSRFPARARTTHLFNRPLRDLQGWPCPGLFRTSEESIAREPSPCAPLAWRP